MINFYGNTNCIKAKKRAVKSIVNSIIKDHRKTLLQLDYIFVSDDELLEINIKSLGHDFFTDIITFDYTVGTQIEGEIYISTERVKENAGLYKETFHVELIRVILHGVLHMVGYKDKTAKQKIQMREMENKYIKQYEELFHVEQ